MKIKNYKLKIIGYCILSLIISSFLIMIFNQAKQIEVDAATFDAPLLPGNDNQYNLGSSASNQRWKNALFSGSLVTTGNISIGTTTIADRLYVTNGNITQELNNDASAIYPISIGSNICNNTNYNPTSIKISGRYAYIIAIGCLSILDISNPIFPKEVGYVPISWPNQLSIFGRYAFTLHSPPSGNNTNFRIIDISNSSNPTLLFNEDIIPRSNEDKRFYIFGHYAYITSYCNLCTGNERRDWLYIVDISNPQLPKLIGEYLEPDYWLDDIFVLGRYAYILSRSNDALLIFDISNPKSPQRISSYLLNATPEQNIFVSGAYAYIGITTNSGRYPAIAVINISNPYSPNLISNFNLDNFYSMTGDIYVSGKYAYRLANEYSTLKSQFYIIDISNQISPRIVNKYSLEDNTNTNNIFIAGHYAYITAQNKNQIQIFDISGLEAVSANIHSLEAGNLQVRNDIIAQGQLQISGGINVGIGGIFSAGPIGISISSTTQTDAVSAYFQGRVGIATTTPTQKLEVNGGIRLYGNSESTCDVSGGPATRGTLRFTQSGAGVADKLEICNSSSTAPGGYDWRKLY